MNAPEASFPEEIDRFVRMECSGLEAILVAGDERARKFAAYALTMGASRPSDLEAGDALWAALMTAIERDRSGTDFRPLWEMCSGHSTRSEVEMVEAVPFVATAGHAAARFAQGRPERVATIVSLLDGDDDRPRLAGLWALVRGSLPEAAGVLPALIRCLDSENEDVRRLTAEVLGKFGPLVCSESVLSRLQRLYSEEQVRKGPHYYGQMGYPYYSSYSTALSKLL